MSALPTFLAHAFGKRYELPIPLILFVLGGALVVLASFALVANRAVAPEPIEPPADVTHVDRLRPLLAAGSLIWIALLTAAGLLGGQTVSENIVPTVFWLLVWIAVPLSCGLIGDWTQGVNPFANIAKLAGSSSLRRTVLGSETPLTWPRRLGWWPAAGLVAGGRAVLLGRLR